MSKHVHSSQYSHKLMTNKITKIKSFVVAAKHSILIECSSEIYGPINSFFAIHFIRPGLVFILTGADKTELYYYLTSPFILISHYFHVEYVIDHAPSTSMALARTKCHNYLITYTYQNIRATD